MMVRLGEKAFLPVTRITQSDTTPSEERSEIKKAEAKEESFREVINKLVAWGRDNAGIEAKSEWDVFYKKIDQREFAENVIVEENYDQMKSAVVHICKLLYDNHTNTTLNNKVTIYKNLLNQLNVCSAGTFLSLQSIERQLDVKAGMAFWLMAYRRSIMENQIANEITQELYYMAQGMQVHVAEACVQYGNKRKLCLSPENAKSVKDNYKVTFSSDIKNKIRNKFDQLYTPANIVDCLVNDFTLYLYQEIEKNKKNYNHYPKLTLAERATFCNKLDDVFSMLDSDMGLGFLFKLGADDVSVEVEEQKEFSRKIRPYILKYVFENKIIRANKKEKLVLNTYVARLQSRGKELLCTKKDTLNYYGNCKDFSWIEAADGNLYSLQDYDYDKIPDKIKLKILLENLKEQTRKIKFALIEYKQSALDWQSRALGRVSKIFRTILCMFSTDAFEHLIDKPNYLMQAVDFLVTKAHQIFPVRYGSILSKFFIIPLAAIFAFALTPAVLALTIVKSILFDPIRYLWNYVRLHAPRVNGLEKLSNSMDALVQEAAFEQKISYDAIQERLEQAEHKADIGSIKRQIFSIEEIIDQQKDLKNNQSPDFDARLNKIYGNIKESLHFFHPKTIQFTQVGGCALAEEKLPHSSLGPEWVLQN